MNYSRLALAAVVATVADFVYGYVVYGKLLTSQFARYPAVYRPAAAQISFLPVMFAGFLVAIFVAAYIYAKGYEGTGGLQEGMRFGVLMGLFIVFYAVAGNYATTNIGKELTASLALAGLVEWIIVGTVIGLVYKPAATARRRGGV